VSGAHPDRVKSHHPKPWDREGEVTLRYEIRIRGQLGRSLLASFEGMEVVIDPTQTALQVEIVDQAQLHGVLERIQLLGLELIEVRQIPARASPA
jgi:hypothetical protein